MLGRKGAILLANSPGQNPCGKICSHHGTRLDKNRILVLSYSTITHNTTRSCRLVVISPAVSGRFRQASDAAGQIPWGGGPVPPWYGAAIVDGIAVRNPDAPHRPVSRAGSRPSPASPGDAV